MEWWKRLTGGGTSSQEKDDEVLLPPGIATGAEPAQNPAPIEVAESDKAAAAEAAAGGESVEDKTAVATPPVDAGAQQLTGTGLIGITADKNTLLLAVVAAGITTTDQLNKVLANAENGEVYAKEVSESLKAEAIRLFGDTKGPKLAQGMAHLPVTEQKTMASTWAEAADAKFDIAGKEGKEGAKRASAASGAVSVDVDAGATEPKTYWERLTPEQKTKAKSMGMDAADKQEAFAKTALGL